MPQSIQRLQDAFDAAAIPIDGISFGPPLRVDYRPEATAQQRSAGDALVAGFDSRPRRPRKAAAIFQAINALSAADRTKLITAVCTAVLIDNPLLAQRIGINIGGDEPDV